MLHRLFRIGMCLTPLVMFLLWGATAVLGQKATIVGEWRVYGGDLANTRYSALDQINSTNFKQLHVAWRFKTENFGPRADFNLQMTPLMIDGVLYATVGSSRNVVALDGATGEVLWTFRLDESKRATPRNTAGRGLAYWTDGRGDNRLFFVSRGYQLVALDAKTGDLVPNFGTNGVVDLRQGNDQAADPTADNLWLSAPPVIAKDVAVIGATVAEGNGKSQRNVKGYVRGVDVRTGKQLWLFHTVPQPGEFGNETWEGDSWAYTGNTGVWTQMSADEELGLVYLPIETPTGDYYGGHRPGNNLFAESLVALDIRTGKRVWHYQFIHHGIWDYDIPCAPILADITVNGKRIKAIAQPTKQAWLYVFDRQTGEPVWPILEKLVPRGDVPGEWYAPTQPFPTKPPAFDQQGTSVDDLIDFTPELRAEAMKIASRYKLGPIFTPGVILKQPDGPLGTLMLPGVFGGANWPGGSYDPETGILYVHSEKGPKANNLRADPELSAMTYVGLGGQSAVEVQGLPLFKPPWGRISAIDLNKGEIVWQVAHGETPDHVRNHPALKGLTIPRTGRPGRIGTLVTKTLVISGEPGFVTTPSGQRGAMLRAYDKATGTEVGEVFTVAPQTGSPMTYSLNGKQYILVAVGGGTVPAELTVYALPAEKAKSEPTGGGGL